MDCRKRPVSQSVDSYDGFEQLVERGSQMHNQAVFELFASLVSHAIPFLTKGYGILMRKQDPKDYNGGLSIKYSS